MSAPRRPRGRPPVLAGRQRATLILDKETRAQLARRAEEWGVSLSEVIRRWARADAEVD